MQIALLIFIAVVLSLLLIAFLVWGEKWYIDNIIEPQFFSNKADMPFLGKKIRIFSFKIRIFYLIMISIIIFGISLMLFVVLNG